MIRIAVTMTTLGMDFVKITVGILVTSAGLLSITVSLFQLRNKDFTLFNFGIFGFLYGLRWLLEIPTMQTLVGFPFTFPYFHAFLTYALAIPLSAFLVDIFGKGFYNSMVWVFRSTYIYAAGAIAFDLIFRSSSTDAGIFRPLVVAWGLVWIVNVLLFRKQRDIELHVLRFTFLITVIFIIIDQLISTGIIILGFQLEQLSFGVLFTGLGFVAVHHFFINEKKLHSIEQEIEIARRIQQSNLPNNFSSPLGLDIAARYIPMTTVAGDFYDIRIKEKTDVGLLIADVSGHGVGAALIGSMLKVAFASQTENLTNPVRMLTEINRILQRKIEDSFVTACYVLFDIINSRIVYTNAGHPPPFLWNATKKEFIRLSLGGTVLGPFESSVYKCETLNIAKGDRLVLYTDGFIEAKNRAGELFGEERLEEFLRAHLSGSANSTADQLIEYVSKWSGKMNKKSYDDDLTLIIIDVVSELNNP
jgi:sigma-B regulation protein RsbU (phosphoserine phosphatase)